MIKKTILLVTAVMIAASSASYAAKTIKVDNLGDKDYWYKVGNSKPTKIPAGASKRFSLKGLKKVRIISGEKKSGNNVTGNKKTLATLSISQAKATPYIQTNPVSGQTTDLSN